MACCPSFRMCMVPLIHLVKRSGSLSVTVAWDQLMTLIELRAWSVRAYLLCSVKFDARRLLMCVMFWIPLQSCSVNVIWLQTSFQFHRLGLVTIGTHSVSKRPYTSGRKDNRPWTVMRAATNWATHTTAFLARRLLVVSRTGRTEYQLLLMKATVLDNNFWSCLMNLTIVNFQPDESIHRAELVFHDHVSRRDLLLHPSNYIID